MLVIQGHALVSNKDEDGILKILLWIDRVYPLVEMRVFHFCSCPGYVCHLDNDHGSINP